jgi:hypothetical protein
VIEAVVELLRRERYGARSPERARGLPDSGQVSVRVDPVESADAKRRERPINLQTSELALDCGAILAELAEASRFARDHQVQAVGLDPTAR